jgi:hypothetical protein
MEQRRFAPGRPYNTLADEPEAPVAATPAGPAGRAEGRRPAPRRAGDRRQALGVFLLLLALYLLTLGGHFYISDGVVVFRTAQALVERRTIVVPPDPDLPGQIVPNPAGLHFGKYGLGLPLLATLPYSLAGPLQAVAFPTLPRSHLQHYLVTWLNPVLTALTGLLVFLLARRLDYDPRLARALALAWGTCTLAWPYTNILFGEPFFTFLLVLAAFALLAYRQAAGPRRLLGPAVAGGALGYTLLTRAAGATLLPPFLLYALWAALPHPEGAPLRALAARIRGGAPGARADGPSPWVAAPAAGLAFLAPFGACVALLLWHNAVRYGHPLDGGYADEGFNTQLRDGLFGLLLSPGKSLFLYVPLAALAPVAWPRFWRRQPATATLFAALFAITLVQYALWWAWWGGWCWGPRFLVPTLPFLVLGLGPLLRESRLARDTAWPLAAVGLGMALLGTLVDINPHLDLVTRWVGEPDAYFWPGLSPILAHARSLAAGEYLTPAVVSLRGFGFGLRDALLFHALVAALLGAALALLHLGGRAAARAMHAGCGAPAGQGAP